MKNEARVPALGLSKRRRPDAAFETQTSDTARYIRGRHTRERKTLDAIFVYKNTEAPDAVGAENKSIQALDAKQI